MPKQAEDDSSSALNESESSYNLLERLGRRVPIPSFKIPPQSPVPPPHDLQGIHNSEQDTSHGLHRVSLDSIPSPGLIRESASAPVAEPPVCERDDRTIPAAADDDDDETKEKRQRANFVSNLNGLETNHPINDNNFRDERPVMSSVEGASDSESSLESEESTSPAEDQTRTVLISSSSNLAPDEDVHYARHLQSWQDRAMAQYEAADETFHYVRNMIGRFVNNKDVQFLIVVLIAVNGLMMGIGTYDFVRENPPVNRAFDMFDQICLIIFTVELGLQFLYHGWRLFLDGWLLFDFVIITISWSFSSVAIVRAFRIFRALRLITRVKVMKNLILALFSVIPRMFAIALLLSLMSYIFAVMFTQLFKNMYENGQTDFDYFSSLFASSFTLFQIMTLDNWSDIARQVMALYSWAWLPIMTYLIVTGFVVMNLIIAVICDAVSALEDEERAKLLGTYEEESTMNDESQHPALQEDVREQLDVLETYVDELSNMQEQTLRTLQILTRQLEEIRQKKSKSGSGSSNENIRLPRGRGASSENISMAGRGSAGSLLRRGGPRPAAAASSEAAAEAD